MGTQGAIDIVVNVRTPQEMANGLNPTDASFAAQVKQPAEIAQAKGVSVEDYIRKMDRCGIERSLLIAVRCGDMRRSTSMHLSYERVHEICQAHPDRFSGLAGIDPTQGLAQLRELEHAVKDLGFVGGPAGQDEPMQDAGSRADPLPRDGCIAQHRFDLVRTPGAVEAFGVNRGHGRCIGAAQGPDRGGRRG